MIITSLRHRKVERLWITSKQILTNFIDDRFQNIQKFSTAIQIYFNLRLILKEESMFPIFQKTALKSSQRSSTYKARNILTDILDKRITSSLTVTVKIIFYA